MSRIVLAACAAVFAIALGVTGACAQQTPAAPLKRAHAHNDYEHERPLTDALEHGFTSVEADIWLVDGMFYVAHDFDEIDRRLTLQGLYLDPLRARIEANGGSVYGDGTPFNLLIDVKSAAAPSWSALAPVLADYRDILTAFSALDGRIDGPVTVHISGNRDVAAMGAAGLRYAGVDGRVDRLMQDGVADPALYTMMSQNWARLFDWDGTGAMPADEEAALAAYSATVRENGQLLRFWNTPDDAGAARDALWTRLVEHDVDLINTDDLAGLEAFLRVHDPAAGSD